MLSWQNRVLGRQVLFYNSVLLLVLVLVWILVTFTEFNYNSNVLDPFWFSIVFSILGEYISSFLSAIINQHSAFLEFVHRKRDKNKDDIQKQEQSINKFGLSVSLFVCLFVSNKRQNGWTDRAQILVYLVCLVCMWLLYCLLFSMYVVAVLSTV